MQKPEIFSLGGLTFDAIQFEVPEDLELGKTTLGGVEDIPQTDGKPARRVSQTHGVVCDQIKFEATFLGDNAEDKALRLEAMQLKQEAVVFQRAARTYDVVIYNVRLIYHSAHEIKYSVDLEPLAETNAAGSDSGSPASDVADDTDAINQTLASSPLDTRLGGMNTAAGNALSFLGGFGSLESMTIPNLDDALIAIVAAIDLAQALMGELADSTLPLDVTAYLFADRLAGGFGRMALSLGTFVGIGASPVSPNGANAYDLVTQYTGDIGNVDDFMSVNNLTDPMNLGSGQLVMPGL